jgi:hypothetical protein
VAPPAFAGELLNELSRYILSDSTLGIAPPLCMVSGHFAARLAVAAGAVLLGVLTPMLEPELEPGLADGDAGHSNRFQVEEAAVDPTKAVDIFHDCLEIAGGGGLACEEEGGLAVQYFRIDSDDSDIDAEDAAGSLFKLQQDYEEVIQQLAQAQLKEAFLEDKVAGLAATVAELALDAEMHCEVDRFLEALGPLGASVSPQEVSVQGLGAGFAEQGLDPGLATFRIEDFLPLDLVGGTAVGDLDPGPASILGEQVEAPVAGLGNPDERLYPGPANAGEEVLSLSFVLGYPEESLDPGLAIAGAAVVLEPDVVKGHAEQGPYMGNASNCDEEFLSPGMVKGIAVELMDPGLVNVGAADFWEPEFGQVAGPSVAGVPRVTRGEPPGTVPEGWVSGGVGAGCGLRIGLGADPAPSAPRYPGEGRHRIDAGLAVDHEGEATAAGQAAEAYLAAAATVMESKGELSDEYGKASNLQKLAEEHQQNTKEGANSLDLGGGVDFGADPLPGAHRDPGEGRHRCAAKLAGELEQHGHAGPQAAACSRQHRSRATRRAAAAALLANPGKGPRQAGDQFERRNGQQKQLAKAVNKARAFLMMAEAEQKEAKLEHGIAAAAVAAAERAYAAATSGLIPSKGEALSDAALKRGINIT